MPPSYNTYCIFPYPRLLIDINIHVKNNLVCIYCMSALQFTYISQYIWNVLSSVLNITFSRKYWELKYWLFWNRVDKEESPFKLLPLCVCLSLRKWSQAFSVGVERMVTAVQQEGLTSILMGLEDQDTCGRDHMDRQQQDLTIRQLPRNECKTTTLHASLRKTYSSNQMLYKYVFMHNKQASSIHCKMQALPHYASNAGQCGLVKAGSGGGSGRPC